MRLDHIVEYKELNSLGFPGYRVGSDGSVWSRGKSLGVWKAVQGFMWKNGRTSVRLCYKGQRKHYPVDEIMLLVFVGTPPPNHFATHKNKNNKDNRLSNLSWAIVEDKTCSKCKKTKPLSDFHKGKSWCKDCKSKESGYIKQNIVPSLSLTSQATAYIAGLIDGEGCLRIQKGYNKKKKLPFFTASLMIGNTHSALVEIYQETKIGYLSYRKGTERHKPCHIWVLPSNACRALLPLVYPYLRIKKLQANAVLRFLELAKHAYYRDKTLKNEVEQLYQQTKLLNKKGNI